MIRGPYDAVGDRENDRGPEPQRMRKNDSQPTVDPKSENGPGKDHAFGAHRRSEQGAMLNDRSH